MCLHVCDCEWVFVCVWSKALIMQFANSTEKKTTKILTKNTALLVHCPPPPPNEHPYPVTYTTITPTIFCITLINTRAPITINHWSNILARMAMSILITVADYTEHAILTHHTSWKLQNVRNSMKQKWSNCTQNHTFTLTSRYSNSYK